MNKVIRYLILLGIGVCSAIFASAPLYFSACTPGQVLAAFIQWLVMPFIIPFIQWPIWPSLKGIISGELLSIPVMILVFVDDPISVVPIIMSSGFLGMIVSIVGKKFAY